MFKSLYEVQKRTVIIKMFAVSLCVAPESGFCLDRGTRGFVLVVTPSQHDQFPPDPHSIPPPGRRPSE